VCVSDVSVAHQTQPNSLLLRAVGRVVGASDHGSVSDMLFEQLRQHGILRSGTREAHARSLLVVGHNRQ
jgi:hypothetical protein